MRVHNY